MGWSRFGLLAVLVLVLVAPARAQETLSIDTFFGTYSGSGIANSKDSLYFGITLRDLDVVISPAGSGFTIAWTTVLRKGDPANPKVKRKSTSLTFAATDRPGVFRLVDQRDPMSGQPYCWARIRGRTLSVYLMTIDENGIYEIQQYDRTISGSGMDLLYTRIRDGEQVRAVKAKLVRVK